jgi:hypothetical protein
MLEFLAQAKHRALAELGSGGAEAALAMFRGDLDCHSPWQGSPIIAALMTEAAMTVLPQGDDAIRRWLNDFNWIPA